MPRPGDALYYDTATDSWAIPTDAGESLLVAGILSYRADTVQNASSILEFADNAEIEVATMGVWWVVGGSAMEYGSICSWDRGDFRFDADARVTGIAAIVPWPMVCMQARRGSRKRRPVQARPRTRPRHLRNYNG